MRPLEVNLNLGHDVETKVKVMVVPLKQRREEVSRRICPACGFSARPCAAALRPQAAFHHADQE